MLQVIPLSPTSQGLRLTYKTGVAAQLWGIHSMPGRMDLPDDPTALARIAMTETESEDLRDAAWRRLIPIINHIARDAARVNHCQEIEEEAVGYIWQKLQQGKFEPEKGRFDSWSYVVLHHRAADLRRQSERALVHNGEQKDRLNIEAIPDGRAGETDAASDALVERLDHLRTVLDRLSGLLPCEANGVAYFAVLLLHLRLALARRATHAGLSESRLVAWLLPWRPGESELRFRSGWPTLLEVWEGICALFDQPPHWITGMRLCDELRRLFGGSWCIAPDVWAQWVRRAKRAVRRHLDERTWSELFAPFFPDR